MIKHVFTKSRREVERAIITNTKLSNHPWALISIWSAEELVTPFNREILANIGCQEVLSSCFSDVTKDEFEKSNLSKEGCVLFSTEKAKEIVHFIDKINVMEISDLFVHCAAGICRSGAVAVWANRYFNLDDKKFKETNPHILPNPFVLSLLNEVSGLNSDYAKWWEDEINKEKRKRLHNRNLWN